MIDGVLIDLENKMIETYEQRLQQQEEFNQTLDHLDESILIVSPDTIQFVNDQFIDLLYPII